MQFSRSSQFLSSCSMSLKFHSILNPCSTKSCATFWTTGYNRLLHDTNFSYKSLITLAGFSNLRMVLPCTDSLQTLQNSEKIPWKVTYFLLCSSRLSNNSLISSTWFLSCNESLHSSSISFRWSQINTKSEKLIEPSFMLSMIVSRAVKDFNNFALPDDDRIFLWSSLRRSEKKKQPSRQIAKTAFSYNGTKYRHCSAAGLGWVLR